MFMKDWSWLSYLIVFPFLGLYCYFGTFIVYYCSKWMIDFNNPHRFWKYFCLVAIYVAGFTLSISISTLFIYLSTLRKSRLLHERMIKKLVNAPINTYFEKTPSGNILNKFSRDLNKIDTELYR